MELEEGNLDYYEDIFQFAKQGGDLEVMDETLAEIAKLAGKDSAMWQLNEGRRLVWLVEQERANPSL